MRITDLLNKESILLGGASKSKSETIDMLVELQTKGGNIADKDEFLKIIDDMENEKYPDEPKADICRLICKERKYGKNICHYSQKNFPL